MTVNSHRGSGLGVDPERTIELAHPIGRETNQARPLSATEPSHGLEAGKQRPRQPTAKMRAALRPIEALRDELAAGGLSRIDTESGDIIVP